MTQRNNGSDEPYEIVNNLVPTTSTFAFELAVAELAEKRQEAIRRTDERLAEAREMRRKWEDEQRE